MDNLYFLFRRARRIYQTEGFYSLVRQGFALVLKQFFWYQRVWLLYIDLKNTLHTDETDVIPRIGNFTFKIVTTNHEADELEADGFEFRSYPFFVNAKKALDKHAMALCVFVGKELGTIAWVASSQEAMNSLGEPPVNVGFSSKEVWIGGMWTNPRYRRMSLRTYRQFKMRRFLIESGIEADRSQISKRNTIALKGSLKRGAKIYGEGRYLKILWWRSGKETPISSYEHQVSRPA